MIRRYLLPLAAVVASAAAAIVFLPAGAAAGNPTLSGVVGPGFNISLKDAGGSNVTHLDPGTYTVVVSDQSADHNFHLKGPGVDEKTSVDDQGTVTWTVTLTDGTYTFVCDAHPSSMKGSFTVGTQSNPPPPPPPSGGNIAKGTKLKGVVGPGFTITLKDKRGKRVEKVKAGRRYTIVVSDKASNHNFHLLGPGVNKKTGVAAKKKATWHVKFKKGKTYLFRCDPHASFMKGSFKAV